MIALTLAAVLALVPLPVPGTTPVHHALSSPATALDGRASWLRAPAGTAAAGRALRAFMGPTWRNSRVRVTGPAGSTVVRLTDWMGDQRRVIDLNPGAFRAACGPLSRGVCAVRVVRA